MRASLYVRYGMQGQIPFDAPFRVQLPLFLLPPRLLTFAVGVDWVCEGGYLGSCGQGVWWMWAIGSEW